jgi:uncharacterized protein
VAAADREPSWLQANASGDAADMSATVEGSPFHTDELEAQARAGQAAKGSGIRNFMPDQHRSFFPLLPYLFVAAADAEGWPLATMLTGRPSFVHAPDPFTLRIDSTPEPEDPATTALVRGQNIGILGLDLTTRRRNRANGRIVDFDATGLTVAVSQSFGNCAKYIQRRTTHDAPPALAWTETFAGLDAKARALIDGADTFFVASCSRAGIEANGGLDISHRGGRSGFVRVDGNALTIPDFPGNRYFNTFGNLLGEPRASLLFIDFDCGNLLQLQGIATLDWRAGAATLVGGAERCWHFDVVRGWRRHPAASLRWSFIDYSPITLSTGRWNSS